MKKIILSLVSLVLMFGFIGAVSAATINVPDDYSTIQAAIDAASHGDTINIAAGTYVEQIIIDKSITLQGESKETTIIEYPLAPVSDQYLILVRADDVTITGFKLLGHFAADNRAVYIVHSQGTGLIVENNEIQGFIGVFGNLINGKIRNNIIGTNRKGIYVPGGSNLLNLLIEGNTIEPAEGADSYAYNCGAIYMDHATDVTIRGNTMRDFSSSVDSGITAGRGIEGSHNNNIMIFDNTFDNTRDSITMWIVTDIEIDKNTITNSDRYGINIKGQNINIINNKISGSGDSGVRIDEFSMSTQNVNVNFNDITGNANYGIKNGWSGEVNAEYNWWGIADGNVITTMISGNVDYDPWLCEHIPTDWYSENGVCILPDMTPPTITDIVVEPNIVLHGDTITVIATVTDDDSGVKAVSADFFYEAGGRPSPTSVAMYKVGGITDQYKVEYVVPNTWNDGIMRIHVAARDNAGNYIRSTEYDEVIVDNTAPLITFVAPVSGSTHSGVINLRAECNEVCNYINFWWRAEDESFSSASKRYHYVHDDGTVFEWGLNTLDAQKADGTSYVMVDGTYYLYAAGKDLAGNWARTPQIMVIVDNTAPVVTINSPTDGSLVSGTVDIFGSIIEENELSHYNIAIYPGDVDFMDFSKRLEQETVYQSSGFDNELIYQWDTTIYDDGEYLIRLAARDKAGNRDLSGDPYSGGDDSQHVISVFVGNTKAGILKYNGVPGKGIANAPGLQKAPPNDNFAKGTANKK